MNGVFDDLDDVAKEYLLPMVQDPANREWSWGHCYTFFQNYRDWNEKQRRADRELAPLHLGFYLASWGMFRGSGLLIQKDYTIYGAIIDRLLADRYKELWNADFFQDLFTSKNRISPDNAQVGLVFDLVDQIRKYVDGLPVTGNPGRPVPRCTDTIVTKILLGTLACTPAYDQYFPVGLTVHRARRCGSFTRDCFTNLLNVCREEHLWQRLCEDPIEYPGVDPPIPLMRVVDLYFWYKGFCKSREKRL
ncbi:MAG: hypothetical protein NTZ17_15030 [Phycisphaerae bacterium]|nr:hypothetical protein [Phycisphaerae bacterium]